MARKSTPTPVDANTLTAAYYETARLVRGMAEAAAYEGNVDQVHSLVTEERRLMNTARLMERRYGGSLLTRDPYAAPAY
jgi:hypothetical protein